MNALLRKEIRSLLPVWVAAMFLAVVPAWFIPLRVGHDDTAQALMFGFFCLGALLLCLTPFGQEFSGGTFSQLLSQPVSRHRLWRVKVGLFFIAALLALFAFSISYRLRVIGDPDLEASFGLLMKNCALAALVIFTGGLWTTLLLRQAAAAFWLTILIPVALLYSIVELLTRVFHLTLPLPEWAGFAVLGFYSLAGFLWARWQFLRAQDTQWTGGTISLPLLRKPAVGSVSAGAKQLRRPLLALVGKEFQLHNMNLLIAGGLLLLHLGFVALRTTIKAPSESMLRLISESFWAFWLVMPLLLGGSAVAGERQLGTLESHLCLSVRRRVQFAIKFAVAFVLGVLLGGVMPWLLEPSSSFIGIRVSIHSDFGIESQEPGLEALVSLLVMSGGIGAISFYASTLGRSTLQALGSAALGTIVTWVLVLGAFQHRYDFNPVLWRGWLIYLISVPVMILVLAALAYRNYTRALIGWNVWRANLLVLVASLSFVSAMTAAIYNRTWELLTSLEPPHAAARLTPSQPVAMQSDGNTLTVRLPDGRIWSDRLQWDDPKQASLFLSDWKLKDFWTGGRFLEGTNWVSLARSHSDFVAIHKDGSLWVTEEPERSHRGRQRRQSAEPVKMVRLGDANDWKSVAGLYSVRPAFLVKTDGTLWRLGSTQFGWGGLRDSEPQRLGTDVDWTEVYSANSNIYFRKADDRVWLHQGFSLSRPELSRLDQETAVTRVPYLDQRKWRSLAWCYSEFTSFQVGVREDGTLRVLAANRPPPNGQLGAWTLVEQDIQLGKESNWLAVASNSRIAVTLKADGTLWKWDFPADPVTKPEMASAVRLSAHSDWVAIAEVAGGLVCLAADGSLWFWQFEPRSYFAENAFLPPLLGASRKPELVGNILELAQ